MKVIISGGGTGGHLYPALAIGRAFRELGAEILYIGSEFGIEKKVMGNDEFDCRLLPIRGLRGGKISSLPKSAWMVLKSERMAKKIVVDFDPDLIVGTGGYASFPVLRAGQSLHIPTLLHEANAEMGKANLALAKKADTVCLTYQDTVSQLGKKENVLLTGMPVRRSVAAALRTDGARYVGIDDDVTLVVITGGSQGAHHINMAMKSYYETHSVRENVLFYHIAGRLNRGDIPQLDYPNVRVIEYEDQMDLVLARADILVGRAGASSLAEISLRGIASILVPYPFSHGHQEKNAAYYDRHGAAKMVLDEEMAEKLAPALDRLIEDKSYRRQLSANILKEARADALDTIVAAGLELINPIKEK